MTKSDVLSDDIARFLVFASAFFLLWFLSLYVVFWPTGLGECEEQYIYILFFISAPLCAAIGIGWKTFSPAPDDEWPLGKSTTATPSTCFASLYQRGEWMLAFAADGRLVTRFQWES